MIKLQLEKKKISAGSERILYLMLIMLVVTFLSVLMTSTILYYAAFEQQEQRLLETARSQARFMEAVAHFDSTHGGYNSLDEAFEASLSQMVDANKNFKGFGRTGEFTMAELKEKRITFLLNFRHRENALDRKNAHTIMMGDPFAEPMQKALRGETGVMVGKDYRGERVLAAYEPVYIKGRTLAIVAKIDMYEIIEPFIYATAITAILGVGFISIAVLVFRRVGQPLVRELEESEERFRSTFEQAAVGMAHVAPDGKWLYVNEKLCQMLDYNYDELVGKSFRDITCSEDLPQGEDYVEKMIGGEIDAYFLEKRYVTKNGSLIWVNKSVSLVRKSTGKPKYFIYVIKDISERKQAEEELLHKRRLAAMGEMSAHIAHDIRSPLSTIGLAHDYVKNHINHSKQVDEALECMEDGINHINSIVTDLLDFGKKGKLNKESFNINDLINTILADSHEVIKEKGLKLTSRLDEKPLLLNADKTKLRQVLTNLIDNALHSMEEWGTLTVVTEDKGGVLKIVISDTGSGIETDELPKVFTPFFTTKNKGTGLGMAIVKHYVDLHGGQISLESEVGKGTRVTIELPL